MKTNLNIVPVYSLQQMVDELCYAETESRVLCRFLDGKESNEVVTLKNKDANKQEFVFLRENGQILNCSAKDIFKLKMVLLVENNPESHHVGEKNLKFFNDTFPKGITVRLRVAKDDSNNNLYAELECRDGVCWDLFMDITRNVRPMNPFYAFVKDVDENEGMCKFLQDNGIARPSFAVKPYPTGFITLNAYLFNPDRLKELSRTGYFQYASLLLPMFK